MKERKDVKLCLSDVKYSTAIADSIGVVMESTSRIVESVTGVVSIEVIVREFVSC